MLHAFIGLLAKMSDSIIFKTGKPETQVKQTQEKQRHADQGHQPEMPKFPL